jgi:hypothetical protein
MSNLQCSSFCVATVSESIFGHAMRKKNQFLIILNGRKSPPEVPNASFYLLHA